MWGLVVKNTLFRGLSHFSQNKEYSNDYVVEKEERRSKKAKRPQKCRKTREIMGYEVTGGKIMYSIYLDWGKDMPKRPLKNDPLVTRILGGFKTPSQWARLAQDAEKEERWGDAYHYWLAAQSEYTRSVRKGNEMGQNAEKCLKKWENSKKSFESD